MDDTRLVRKEHSRSLRERHGVRRVKRKHKAATRSAGRHQFHKRRSTKIEDRIEPRAALVIVLLISLVLAIIGWIAHDPDSHLHRMITTPPPDVRRF